MFSGVSAVMTTSPTLPNFPKAAPFFLAALTANLITMVLSVVSVPTAQMLPAPAVTCLRDYPAPPSKAFRLVAFVLGCLTISLWFAGVYVACMPLRSD